MSVITTLRAPTCFRNRHRHDADRARAGNEHVLADEVERQRRMRRVAEWIEDGSEVVGDFGRNLEGVKRRNHQILGERALAIHADADGCCGTSAGAGTGSCGRSRT